MNNVKAIQRITATELAQGRGKKSWHDMYSGSAYIFIGGLNYDLTEGDVLAVFSQYGEVMNINLVRDKKTGKSKGFCFLCYENQKSTVLAVDNLNGIKLCGRIIRVDHVAEYRRPKDEDGNEIIEKGVAPKTPTPSPEPSESESEEEPEKVKKKKKTKKPKDKKKKKRKDNSSSSPPYKSDEYSRSKKQSRRDDSSPELSRKASKRTDREYKSERSSHSWGESKDRDSYRHEEERRYRDSYRNDDRMRYRDRSRSHSRDRKEQYRKKY